VGVPIWTDAHAENWLDRARRSSFGKLAWSGAARCVRCNQTIHELRFAERAGIQLHGGLETMSLRLPCACDPAGGAILEGPAADRVLRRVLAYHNFAGASQPDIVRASNYVETAIGTPQLGKLLAQARSLAEFGPVSALALEIAFNQAAELETRWRAEETIAAIADRELSG
jgi:hypothetical protein